MKKVMIIAAMAASMACTKTVVYDAASEIGFRPVAENPRTRTVYGPMNTTYSAEESFNVFAYHSGATVGSGWNDFKAAAGGMTTYLDNKKFTKKADGNNWGGSPDPYFWPKTGSLMFAGYSPALSSGQSTGEPSYSTVTYTTAYVEAPYLSVLDFVQGNYSSTADQNKMVDLMWFSVDDDGVTSSNNQASASTAVAVKFHHALSWLTFKFVLGTDCTDLFYITSAKLSSIFSKGTLKGTKNGAATWTIESGTKSEYDLLASQESALTKSGLTADNLLVIPYDFTNDESYVLTVKFKQGSVSGLEQTANIKLKDNESVKSWEAGKHYTYTVTMTSAEILLAPSVSDWSDVTAEGITVN